MAKESEAPVITALRIDWLADGLAELEAAIAAQEWALAWKLALFIDREAEGSIAVARLAEAQERRRRL